ncbi:WxL protein peptidoglycan domain-containing protein [Microbacterium tumbae]
MIIRSTTRLLAAFALAAASVLVPAVTASAAGADDVTWTVRTASNDLGDDRTSYSYAINPGAEVADALVVANHGDEDLTLAVYAADGYTTDGGQFDVDTLDEEATGIGDWVGVDEATVTIAAGETASIPFTVAVPANAMPGDYAGGIVTSLAEDSGTAGVSVDRRLGIRMQVRVSGDLVPSMSVEDVRIGWDGGLNPFAGGDATLTWTIRNTGNAIVSANQGATIAGPFGWFAADAPDVASPPGLLPGESWEQSVIVPDVAALVMLTGTATVIPLVTDASGSTTALEPVAATGLGWAVPWTLLVVLVLVVLVLVLLPRYLRRRRIRREAVEEARVEEAVARALEEAAVGAGR